MRLLLAYRFLRSKSNSSFINIISKISVLGIILGISILITVISVMNGFEQQLKDKVLGFTSHITAYSNNTKISSYKIFDDLINTGEISGYSPFIEKEILLSSSYATTNSLFRAIDPHLEKNVGQTHNNIVSGKYNDLLSDNNSIIIGSGVASKLNVNVGDNIHLYTQFSHPTSSKMIQFKERYRIVAIFDVGIYEYNNAYTFINLSNFLDTLKDNNKRHINVDSVRLKLPDPLKSQVFASKFNRDTDLYYAQDWSYTHQSLFIAISNEKRVMFIILMLIVAVAAFNIVSSLLMLVTNKQKEIAVLITLGATKFDITLIFLFQGVFLGILGIILGVISGIILAENIDLVIRHLETFFDINLMPPEIYHLTKIPSMINYSDIIIITLYTFILTLISAIYPAMKASRIKPSVVFRGNI